MNLSGHGPLPDFGAVIIEVAIVIACALCIRVEVSTSGVFM